MFYDRNLDQVFRFGDVVKDFILCSSIIEYPKPESYDFKIDIFRPSYAVILTPCCSIGGKTILLSPLDEIKPSFFDNPYIAEDLTNINRKMTPEQSTPPIIWARMSQEEKDQRFDMSQNKSYAFFDSFIYSEHDQLPKYKLKNKKKVEFETGFRLIDFKKIYKVNCSAINNSKQVPIESKILQSSIETRKELREKLAHYFYRKPKEDDV